MVAEYIIDLNSFTFKKIDFNSIGFLGTTVLTLVCNITCNSTEESLKSESNPKNQNAFRLWSDTWSKYNSAANPTYQN